MVNFLINEYHTNFQKKGALTSKKRLLSRQLLEFFGNIISKFQWRFIKGCGTQHCLLLMLEMWKGAT